MCHEVLTPPLFTCCASCLVQSLTTSVVTHGLLSTDRCRHRCWQHCSCAFVPCMPQSAGLGVRATAAKFAEVIGLTWAGSQVTKVRDTVPVSAHRFTAHKQCIMQLGCCCCPHCLGAALGRAPLFSRSAALSNMQLCPMVANNVLLVSVHQ